jgi:hypothetical protein
MRDKATRIKLEDENGKEIRGWFLTQGEYSRLIAIERRHNDLMEVYVELIKTILD